MPDRLTAEREAEIRRYVAEAAPGSWPFVFLSDVLAELDAVRAELARTETERDEWIRTAHTEARERDALKTALERMPCWPANAHGVPGDCLRCAALSSLDRAE